MVIALILTYFLGGLSVAIGCVAYAFYGWQTYAGVVRPHPLTWLMFGVLTSTSYWIQVDQHAGPGSWVMLLTAICSFMLAAVSVYLGERTFPFGEWFLFGLSLFAFFVYLHTRQPNTSALFATAVDVLAYSPTIMRLNRAPEKESSQNFLLNGAKFIPALFAMTTFSFSTAFYPAVIAVVNVVMAGVIWKRQGHELTVHAIARDYRLYFQLARRID